MTILDKIMDFKRIEVENRRKEFPIQLLEKSIFFQKQTHSLKKILLETNVPRIIAEFKRKSPSKGIINDSAEVVYTTKSYEQAGAAALSVLTDAEFFGGKSADLMAAANFCRIPLLRKEFICSQYQILEAKAFGADLILLIAAVLSKEEIRNFTNLAHSLGLETLLELHDETETDKISPETDIIGVNNRNLKDFVVSIDHSLKLVEKLPSDKPWISESGLKGVGEINTLFDAGFKGFLMGETFMKTNNPAEACANFIQLLNQKI